MTTRRTLMPIRKLERDFKTVKVLSEVAWRRGRKLRFSRNKFVLCSKKRPLLIALTKSSSARISTGKTSSPSSNCNVWSPFRLLSSHTLKTLPPASIASLNSPSQSSQNAELTAALSLLTWPLRWLAITALSVRKELIVYRQEVFLSLIEAMSLKETFTMPLLTTMKRLTIIGAELTIWRDSAALTTLVTGKTSLQLMTFSSKDSQTSRQDHPSSLGLLLSLVPSVSWLRWQPQTSMTL